MTWERDKDRCDHLAARVPKVLDTIGRSSVLSRSILLSFSY